MVEEICPCVVVTQLPHGEQRRLIEEAIRATRSGEDTSGIETITCRLCISDLKTRATIEKLNLAKLGLLSG